MNHRRYASKVAKLFFGVAERKKITFKIFKNTVQLAHLAGQADSVYRVLCRERENSFQTKDELLGELQMRFAETSEEISKFYRGQGMQPTSVEEIMEFCSNDK